MRLRFLAPLLSGLVNLVAFAAEAELPKPELTEVWSPVPPVISSPANGVPSDAIVLLGNAGLGAWEPIKEGSAGWKEAEGGMVVVPKSGDLRTKQTWGDIQLHLEFRAPPVVKGEGQGRGNSGIFFMGLYELQVLDSYSNKTYSNGQVGSIYKQHIPLANPARPPGEWQAYDVVFVAPRFDAAGKLLSPARVTAFLNGVLVLHDVVLRGPTEYRGEPKYRPHADRLPLVLQDHGDLVAFRNIWVRELDLPR